MSTRIREAGDCVAVNWRNGGGTTRTLIQAADGLGEPNWRVSLAELAGRSEFSKFPGFDRVTVVGGTGIERLVVAGHRHDLRHGDSLRYRGEDPAESSVTAAMHNVNFFARRTAWSVEVEVHDGVGGVELGGERDDTHHVAVPLDAIAEVTDMTGGSVATVGPFGIAHVDDGSRVRVASDGMLVTAVFRPAWP